ncbi:hypothetical protein ACFLQJ_00045 [Calditrichota bacterium]
MVSIFSLWLPILLSAVFVFIASSIIHMLLKYHNSDFKKLSDEDGVMDALGKFDISPGNYVFPQSGSMKEMSSPEFIDKLNKGPVAIMTVKKSGMPSMTGTLIQWFIYGIMIGIFVAYISGRALEPGAHYLQVFRFAGATSFFCYSVAS